MNIFDKFQHWYQEELKLTSLKLPAACSFTTIGLDGYPNTRFVSLKEVRGDAFIITGPLNSRKGVEVAACSKVSLAFWWTQTNRQVRVQGDAFPLSTSESDIYFKARNRESQIVSTVFHQGKEIADLDHLKEQFAKGKELWSSTDIPRPEQWGGFTIKPRRVEFMQFQNSRLHERELYQKSADGWQVNFIQP